MKKFSAQKRSQRTTKSYFLCFEGTVDLDEFSYGKQIIKNLENYI